MEPLSLPLSNNVIVTGLRTPPTPSTAYTPLIVALHGGAYSAHYYDATPSHSALAYSKFLNVPFVSLNRPGYLDSTALRAPFAEDSTYCQEEGKYLHHEILPAIWKAYSKEYGVSSIVILAHSLSAPMTIVAAALNASEQKSSYPLAGIILSGFGTSLNHDTVSFLHPYLPTDPNTTHAAIPASVKNEIMLCSKASPSLCDEDSLAASASLNTAVGMAEFADGCGTWATYWRDRYAKYVSCPVMYNLAGEDRLWHANVEALDGFAVAFTGSKRLDKGIVVGAPHCMEFGRARKGWYSRCFGWAIEVGIAFDLEKGAVDAKTK
ncbi:MAG: hypothetical protein L6R41_006994 [Letrouitia leprolyta]|nr:MAG: hypothetical protein L6R41_006994 [Letrouitia leprolyta]